MANPPVATPAETVRALLDKANRLADSETGVPVRRAFVQRGTQTKPAPGLLAQLVRNGDQRGLDLYLLLKAVASAEPFNSHRGAAVWARALHHTGKTASTQTISKIWRRLDDLGLVERSKHGRVADVTLLREDGSGVPYTHPGVQKEPYLQVPVSYWLSGEKWCSTLSLPAKAMLLVALSLEPGFVLPTEQAPNWYGISPDTAQRGLRELLDREALEQTKQQKSAPLAPLGYTEDRRFTLVGDLKRLKGGSHGGA